MPDSISNFRVYSVFEPLKFVVKARPKIAALAYGLDEEYCTKVRE